MSLMADNEDDLDSESVFKALKSGSRSVADG